MVKGLWTPWAGRPEVMGITHSILRKHPELKGSRAQGELEGSSEFVTDLLK